MKLLRFYADAFVRLSNGLQEIGFCLRMDEVDVAHSGADAPDLSPQELADLLQKLRLLEPMMDEMGLYLSVKHLREVVSSINNHQPVPSHEIDALRRNIHRELSLRLCVAVPPNRQAFYSNPLLGWEKLRNDLRIPGTTSRK